MVLVQRMRPMKMYASNQNLCVQWTFMRPINELCVQTIMYASNQNPCVQLKNKDKNQKFCKNLFQETILLYV